MARVRMIKADLTALADGSDEFSRRIRDLAQEILHHEIDVALDLPGRPTRTPGRDVPPTDGTSARGV